jgi:transcriptional regulator with PAS, ATPase and Fis domain
MSSRNVILPSDLPATVGAPTLETSHQCIDSDWPTVAELERRYIAKVLERADGNKTSAAAILGLDRRTLQRLEHAAQDPEEEPD